MFSYGVSIDNEASIFNNIKSKKAYKLNLLREAFCLL